MCAKRNSAGVQGSLVVLLGNYTFLDTRIFWQIVLALLLNISLAAHRP